MGGQHRNGWPTSSAGGRTNPNRFLPANTSSTPPHLMTPQLPLPGPQEKTKYRTTKWRKSTNPSPSLGPEPPPKTVAQPLTFSQGPAPPKGRKFGAEAPRSAPRPGGSQVRAHKGKARKPQLDPWEARVGHWGFPLAARPRKHRVYRSLSRVSHREHGRKHRAHCSSSGFPPGTRPKQTARQRGLALPPSLYNSGIPTLHRACRGTPEAKGEQPQKSLGVS